MTSSSLVDPTRNRFRVYGLTVCRTLFGELCLRIAWGRLGSRRLRERSELFQDEASLSARRDALLALRRRHGYTPRRGREGMAPRTATVPVASPRKTPTAAVERVLVEANGLSLGSADVRVLVGRWYAATRALGRYLETLGSSTRRRIVKRRACLHNEDETQSGWGRAVGPHAEKTSQVT